MNGPYAPLRLTSSAPHQGQALPEATRLASWICAERASSVEASESAFSLERSFANIASSHIGSRRAMSFRMFSADDAFCR